MQRGIRDKMQRGTQDKVVDSEGRRELLEELRRKRALRGTYRERYIPPTGGGLPRGGGDRTAEQIAARPEAWE